MSMSFEESDAYWRNLFIQRTVQDLKSSEFRQQLRHAHSLGLLTEFLEGADIPLAKLQFEIGQILSDRHPVQETKTDLLDNAFRSHS